MATQTFELTWHIKNFLINSHFFSFETMSTTAANFHTWLHDKYRPEYKPRVDCDCLVSMPYRRREKKPKATCNCIDACVGSLKFFGHTDGKKCNNDKHYPAVAQVLENGVDLVTMHFDASQTLTWIMVRQRFGGADHLYVRSIHETQAGNAEIICTHDPPHHPVTAIQHVFLEISDTSIEACVGVRIPIQTLYY